ncbi:sigma factor [Brevibacillus gelatini]|uniref:sigma factor n=1 Tax=Brevibacillus gelatini TaxID=1655277 RepID=UPI003D8169E5
MERNEIEQVVKEVRAGDIDQFGIIIDAMQRKLFVYCYHMLGHRQEAEDAVQEVFLRAYEQLDSYRQTISFSAWLYRMQYITEEAGPDETVEKVSVQKKEALDVASKLPDGTDMRTVKFYQESSKLLFEVSTKNPAISKEELVAIVEKLNEQ